MNILIYIALLASFFATSTAWCQAQAPRFPCEEDARFAEFDFWLGEWDVHVASGDFAGSNVITSPYRSCVLIEKWTGAKGSIGMSVNYFDHDSGEWVQIWNDASGSQINIRAA